MNICALQLNNCLLPSPKQPPSSLPSLKPSKTHLKLTKSPPLTLNLNATSPRTKPELPISSKIPRWVFLGGASLSLAFLILGADGQHEALAIGPEGPLVEEFWDNMRRYGLYILTVSTGVIYTVFQPIVELLKNPVTAILIITVVVGGGYLVSQVVNAMVGLSDFSYNYGY
ncbi:uncharacterized protein A4U43_C03F25450 [Asparagus officinalis]|uniref:Uncharacterized protein ycf33 n=1 Tax=Asparagus officinalis TaxID=4686 RepID=A0A5P1FCZ3_ASPOF|nr:uncharacterized protein LOC109834384 [Asparagus officinalis]ONK76238.1 uncharacterized protein A4U43_C03F25450 [Asparagus officinalis]